MKLIKLFNQIFKSSKLPDLWFHSIAYGYYKGGQDTSIANNFRPLVRMDTFSKLFWHIIVERLTLHIQKHNIIDSNIQKAYQRDTHGVVQSLFIHQMVKPESEVVVYLDIKNAFGSLQPSFIKHVLKTYGIPDSLNHLIINYLENRVVWIGKEYRRWNCGVPQGSSLSNLLFILCMNYILTQINDLYSSKFSVKVHNCKFLIQAFADDIVIYGQSVESTQFILNKLSYLLKTACLTLNVNKCIVDYKRKSNKKLYINGIEIPDLKTRPKFKYLGQYADLENNLYYFTRDLKDGFKIINSQFQEKLPNSSAQDYWYSYQVIWKYRINWFLMIFKLGEVDSETISDLEKVGLKVLKV